MATRRRPLLQVYGVLVFTLTAGSAFAQIPDKPLVEASATRSSVPLLSATEGSVVELDVAFAGGVLEIFRSGGSVDMFRQSTRPVPVGEIVLGH